MEKEKKVEKPNDTPYCPSNRWTISLEKCVLCCECVEACPIRLLEEKDEIIMIKDEDGCTQCGDCAAACAYYAIILT